MGQQQLLLIILGVIVVGIAVAVGITMFQDNAVSANRDAVVERMVNLSARAQQYYRRPYVAWRRMRTVSRSDRDAVRPPESS